MKTKTIIIGSIALAGLYLLYRKVNSSPSIPSSGTINSNDGKTATSIPVGKTPARFKQDYTAKQSIGGTSSSRLFKQGEIVSYVPFVGESLIAVTSFKVEGYDIPFSVVEDVDSSSTPISTTVSNPSGVNLQNVDLGGVNMASPNKSSADGVYYRN